MLHGVIGIFLWLWGRLSF